MSTYPKLAALVSLLLVVAISPAAAVSSASYESQVITRTNVKRVDNDRVPVKAQSCADRWAEGQASWMARHQKLQHRSGRLSQVMADCGFSSASENIAYGYSSGNAVVSAWMKSPGHRANLLRKSSRYVGVGAVRDSNGVWWVAQVFGAK